jgi:hypothetical protein
MTMLIARVSRGVTAHFVTRLHEWIFAAMFVGMGTQLLRKEITFNLPIYQVMARYGSEDVWGVVMVAVGVSRFIALTINGTFPRFHTITPLFRSVMAVMSAGVWFALAWGFWKASPTGVSVIAYTGLMFSDLASSWIIAREAGAAYGRSCNGRRG